MEADEPHQVEGQCPTGHGFLHIQFSVGHAVLLHLHISHHNARTIAVQLEFLGRFGAGDLLHPCNGFRRCHIPKAVSFSHSSNGIIHSMTHFHGSFKTDPIEPCLLVGDAKGTFGWRQLALQGISSRICLSTDASNQCCLRLEDHPLERSQIGNADRLSRQCRIQKVGHTSIISRDPW